jgi:hypothetical protein
MSERGFIAVDRGIFDHPVFAPEAFTEREAWLWMIAEAAWKPCKARVGRSLVKVERGQFVHSLRFMATRWRWPEARVRRFLGRLSGRRTGDALVVVLATHEATQVTICNYDKYQDVRRTGDAPSDAPPDAKPTQRRTNNQEPITKEDTSLRSVSPPARPAAREKATSRLSTCPTDFQPDEKTMSEAVGLLGTRRAESELARMRDWSIGKGEKRADWNAVFRNWIRRKDDDHGSEPPRLFPDAAIARPGRSGTRPPSGAEAMFAATAARQRPADDRGSMGDCGRPDGGRTLDHDAFDGGAERRAGTVR